MLARHDYMSCLFVCALTSRAGCLDVALENQIFLSGRGTHPRPVMPNPGSFQMRVGMWTIAGNLGTELSLREGRDTIR